jgi:hypothetical protein
MLGRLGQAGAADTGGERVIHFTHPYVTDGCKSSAGCSLAVDEMAAGAIRLCACIVFGTVL